MNKGDTAYWRGFLVEVSEPPRWPGDTCRVKILGGTPRDGAPAIKPGDFTSVNQEELKELVSEERESTL